MHRIFVGFIVTVSAISLCGWMIPGVAPMLPHVSVWGTMKANNALMVLLCGLSLYLSEPGRTNPAVWWSRLLAAIVTLLAAILVFERFSGVTFAVDTMLAHDAGSVHPGRSSIEACGTLLLVGFTLMNLRARKRLLSKIVDGVAFGIIFLMLTFASRYAFGLSHIFGESPLNPMSLQTFVCVSMLTWLLVNRRAEYGVLCVVIGSQIGSKTTRFAAPCAILLPFVFATAKAMAVKSHLLTETSATAAATASLSIFAFVLILFLGCKTNDLENVVSELSLRDELTKLYNRRGFYVLAEQAFRLAKRSGDSFFVLFIDVDDLKRTNDALGHEVGSELLRAVAGLLENTFRETDVIGRIGGDEFVVAGRVDPNNVENPVRRLEDAASRANSISTEQFRLSFSIGNVVSDASQPTSLEELIHRADEIMYEAKRTKKKLRFEPVAAPA
jgi:diguanylate cyclase (GGDEF)-like protein